MEGMAQRLRMKNFLQNSDLQFVNERMKIPVKPESFKQWAITLSALFVSLCSVLMALRCLQLFSDNLTKPAIGCSIYFFGTVVLCLYFFILRKYDKAHQKNLSLETRYVFIKRETLSESILRWGMSIIALPIVFSNIAAAWVCIYNLPDKSSRPLPGLTFVLTSIALISCLFLRLGKERSQYKKELINYANGTADENPVEESHLRLSGACWQWVTTIITLTVSTGGVSASFICLLSLPDITTRPVIGSLFYFFSSIILIFYIILRWKGEKACLPIRNISEKRTIILKEYFSEKLIKWIVANYTVGFALLSIAAAILCIFSGLQDKSVRPDAAVIYLFSGLSVITIMTYTLWKNQSVTRNP
jgi:hypothetical protein